MVIKLRLRLMYITFQCGLARYKADKLTPARGGKDCICPTAGDIIKGHFGCRHRVVMIKFVCLTCFIRSLEML